MYKFFCKKQSQITGSHEADGKGENIWDKFSNAQDVDGVQGSGKCNVAGCDTGNNACESYKNTERDIQLLKDMGIKVFFFSNYELLFSAIISKSFFSIIDFRSHGREFYQRDLVKSIKQELIIIVNLLTI